MEPSLLDRHSIGNGLSGDTTFISVPCYIITCNFVIDLRRHEFVVHLAGSEFVIQLPGSKIVYVPSSKLVLNLPRSKCMLHIPSFEFMVHLPSSKVVVHLSFCNEFGNLRKVFFSKLIRILDQEIFWLKG